MRRGIICMLLIFISLSAKADPYERSLQGSRAINIVADTFPFFRYTYHIGIGMEYYFVDRFSVQGSVMIGEQFASLSDRRFNSFMGFAGVRYQFASYDKIATVVGGGTQYQRAILRNDNRVYQSETGIFFGVEWFITEHVKVGAQHFSLFNLYHTRSDNTTEKSFSVLEGRSGLYYLSIYL